MNEKTTKHVITAEWAEAFPPMDQAAAWATYLIQCNHGWRFPHVIELAAAIHDDIPGFEKGTSYWVEESGVGGERVVFNPLQGCVEYMGGKKATLRLVRIVPNKSK